MNAGSGNSPMAKATAEFWTGIGLAALGLFMFATALTFPLLGTYAGVNNAWYVSPALFPILLSTLFLVLSALLCLGSLRRGARINLGGIDFMSKIGAGGTGLAVAGAIGAT